MMKFNIALPRPPTERITLTHRNLGTIDLNKFKIDLIAKVNTIKNSVNLQELYNNRYMQTIELTLEIHAPILNKIATKRRINP